MGGSYILSGTGALQATCVPNTASVATTTAAQWICGIDDGSADTKMCLVNIVCSGSNLNAYVSEARYNLNSPLNQANLNSAWATGTTGPVATSFASPGYGVSYLAFIYPTITPI